MLFMDFIVSGTGLMWWSAADAVFIQRSPCAWDGVADLLSCSNWDSCGQPWHDVSGCKDYTGIHGSHMLCSFKVLVFLHLYMPSVDTSVSLAIQKIEHHIALYGMHWMKWFLMPLYHIIHVNGLALCLLI